MTDRFSGNMIASSWLEAELKLAGSLDNRIINLLRAIEQSGSINQAAKQMGLSYKGAWQMVERANNLSPKTLIASATGGSKGGGTSLTPAGHTLLQLFTRLEQQHRQFLQQLNRSLEEDADIMLLLKRLAIKTSATNQLFGVINGVRPGAVNAEVYVRLKGGEAIAASLPLAELKRLGLESGKEVLLLINDTEIVVATDLHNCRSSCRNCLAGKVLRVRKDGVDSEVVIRMPGGDSLTATITQASAEALELKPGIAASAVFNADAVIFALPSGAS